MQITRVEKLLKECLENISDDNKAAEYSNTMCAYLETEKLSNELITLIVRGIEIDQGSNFFDYIDGLSSNKLPEVWKIIKNNTEVKNSSENAIKFLSNFLYATFVSKQDSKVICGKVLTFLMQSIEKKNITEELCEPILRDYFLRELPSNFQYPAWEKLEVTPETKRIFCKILQNIIEKDEESRKNISLNRWLKTGEKSAEEEIREKKLEKKIPTSKIDDLKAIVEHYITIEKEYKELIYELDKKQRETSELCREVNELTSQRDRLEISVRNLKNKLEQMKTQIDGAKKEVEERKKINDAFDALKKNDEIALLNDIANDLKAEYLDFIDSESDKMDIELGEIYREKIRNIFKILKKKGIQVG